MAANNTQQSQGETFEERILWSPSMEKLFIDIMCDQVKKGNMKDGVFMPRVWKLMLVDMNTKAGRLYTMKQLKAKHQRLKARHRAFSDLLAHTGFSWDPVTNTVTADDDVWSNYIKAHREASQFKKKGCDHYEDLGLLFNTGTATSVLHHASTMSPPQTDDEVELEYQYINTGVHVNLDDDEEEDPLDSTILEPKTRGGKRLANPPAKVSRKQAKADYVGNAVQAFVNLQNVKAEKLKSSSSQATSHADDSLDACMAVLNSINEPDEIRVKAMTQFLIPEWRKMFLRMTESLRTSWLKSL